MFSLYHKMCVDLICCFTLMLVSVHSIAMPQQAHKKTIISAQLPLERQLQTVELEITSHQRVVTLPTLSQPLQSAKLFSRTSGYIKALYVDIGDKVSKNDLLATIDDPQIKAQEKKILANIDEAKAGLELKQLNYQRASQLISDHLVSKSDLDRMRILASQAKARIASLRAELEENHVRQSFLEIRAPFTGYIVARDLDVGDLVGTADTSQLRYFFEIVNTARLRLNIHVPQNEIRYIAIGDKVTVNFTGYQSLSVKGRITRLSNAVEKRSGTMLVEAEINNSDYNFPAGLRGTVTVKRSLGSNKNRIFKAPLSAISYHNGKDAIVSVNNGKIKFHNVDIISKSQNSVLLSGDLNTVGQIVLNPNALLMEEE